MTETHNCKIRFIWVITVILALLQGCASLDKDDVCLLTGA